MNTTERIDGNPPPCPDRANMAWLTARGQAHASAALLPAQQVDLPGAFGATLAQALVATEPMPAFDTAAMDGYALGSPTPCRVVGALMAGGRPWPAPLTAGQAVRIATGARVPAGTVYVLRQEDAVLTPAPPDKGGPVVDGPTRPAGTHIRRRGEDAATGEVLAPAGTPVNAALLGLAAASGRGRLTVISRPTVAVIISGDEVAPAASTLAPAQLHDAIGPMLPSLIDALGGTLDGRRHVPDRPTQLLTAIHEASDAAVILVSGATSAGDADGLRDVLAQTCAELVVESVACRPGHPQLLAHWPPQPDRPEQWLIGLPGNPFAAYIAAFTLLGPLLAGLSGRPLPRLPQLVPVGDLPPTRGSATRLVPVRWNGEPAGTAAGRRPSSLRAAAAADALAAIPAGWTPGTPVPVVPLH